MIELAVQANALAALSRLGVQPASAGLAGARGGTGAGAAAVLPPWDARAPQVSETRRLAEALARPIRVEVDPQETRAGGTSRDTAQLFALYRALATLSTLANEAAKETTFSALRPGLDQRFRAGLDAASTALGDFSFERLSVLWSENARSATGAVRVARPSASLTGAVAVRGAFDQAVPGLQGNETFVARIVKNNVTTDVTIDLSELTGPPTLDAIAALANDRLAAAGMVSRFSRVALETDDNGVATAFGLRIQGVSTERLSLIAPDARPAVYVAGASGTDSGETGALIKFGGLDGAAPQSQFRQAMTAEEGSVAPRATAVDADGNVFVVGTASGTLEGQAVKGESDLFLRKYDSVGRLVWSQLLGAADSAEGVSLATAPDGGIVVAGRITGRLSASAVGGGEDAFVAKFASDGSEVFARQVAPLADDGASSVAVAADGSIYVAGYTTGALPGAGGSGGGSDGFVTRLTASGGLVYHRQFGGAGDQRAAAIAIGPDGNLLVASAEDGVARIRKFAAADGTSAPIWEKTLGALAGGAIGQIAVSGSRIFVAGSTSNATLDAGGEAAIARAASGGLDAFVMRLEDTGSDATAQFVSYVGSSTRDRGFGLAVDGDDVYLAGETAGALPGQVAPRERDSFGFIARVSAQDGALGWTQIFTVAPGAGAARGIAIDPQGRSVLDALGLPRGEVSEPRSRLLTANSSLRPGDSFLVSVDGRSDRRITIEADDTVRSLAFKINRVLLLDGKAELRRRDGADALVLTPAEGRRIELKRGPAGSDALVGLGIDPVTLTRTPTGENEAEAARQRPVFALGLTERFSLVDAAQAVRARDAVQDAMAEIRRAYRELTRDPLLDDLAKRQSALRGPVPADLRAQLANYQAGLARLQAVAPASTTLSLF